MTILADALALRARGFSVIPLDHPWAPRGDKGSVGKTPVVPWLPFQTQQADAGQLARWFGDAAPRNIGIVTGSISGIVVVDVDSPDAWLWAEDHLPVTPMRTRTAHGQHLYFRHPGVPVCNRANAEMRCLDVRGDGGYVVAPGSLHRSGARYEQAGDWPDVSELPIFDPGWLGEAERAARPARTQRSSHARACSGRNELVMW